MTDYDRAKFNPQSVFESPLAVLRDASLSNVEKIEILRQWSYDEREMAVAEEENMPALDKERVSRLAEIQKALIALDHCDDSSPTKQGG